MCQFHRKNCIVRPISAVRPSSITYNLRGRYHTISGYDSFKLSVTEDGITAESGLTI